MRRCSNVRHWRSSSIPFNAAGVVMADKSPSYYATCYHIKLVDGFCQMGHHTTEAIPIHGRTGQVYNLSVMLGGRILIFLRMNPSALLAGARVSFMCFVHFIIVSDCTVSFHLQVCVVESISELGRMTFLCNTRHLAG